MLVPAVLSALGAWYRVLTRDGAIAAFFVGTAVILFAPTMFPVLFAMVLMGELATRARVLCDKKRSRNAIASADSLHSPRSAGSVIGNGGVAASLSVICGLLFMLGYVYLSGVMLIAIAGSLAAAASDTVAGEIGRAFRARAVLITTFKPVEVGSNGGVSIIGTIAGAIASFAIAGFSWWMIDAASDLPYALPVIAQCKAFAAFGVTMIIPIALGGIIGNLADSILGATIEGSTLVLGRLRITIGNTAVNLACTLAGAIFAVAFAISLFPT